jgi:hypothetical protein
MNGQPAGHEEKQAVVRLPRREQHFVLACHTNGAALDVTFDRLHPDPAEEVYPGKVLAISRRERSQHGVPVSNSRPVPVLGQTRPHRL